MARAPSECSAQNQVSDRPCLECLSKKELLAILVYLFASELYTLPDQLNDLAEDTACYRCLSDKQKLQGFVSKVYDFFGGQQTVEEIRESVKCLICYGDADLKAMLSGVMCEWIDDQTELV